MCHWECSLASQKWAFNTTLLRIIRAELANERFGLLESPCVSPVGDVIFPSSREDCLYHTLLVKITTPRGCRDMEQFRKRGVLRCMFLTRTHCLPKNRPGSPFVTGLKGIFPPKKDLVPLFPADLLFRRTWLLPQGQKRSTPPARRSLASSRPGRRRSMAGRQAMDFCSRWGPSPFERNHGPDRDQRPETSNGGFHVMEVNPPIFGCGFSFGGLFGAVQGEYSQKDPIWLWRTLTPTTNNEVKIGRRQCV